MQERQILMFALEWIRAHPTSSCAEAGEILSCIPLPRSVLTREVEAAGLNPSDLLHLQSRQEMPHDVDLRSRVPTHILVAGETNRVTGALVMVWWFRWTRCIVEDIQDGRALSSTGQYLDQCPFDANGVLSRRSGGAVAQCLRHRRIHVQRQRLSIR